MVWHEAPLGQFPVANPEQIKAQYWLPEGSCKTHWGEAVVPVGTSVGQDPEEQGGMQASPVKPWIWTATSSLKQPPVGFP